MGRQTAELMRWFTALIQTTEKTCVFPGIWMWQEGCDGAQQYKICRQYCHWLGWAEEVAWGTLDPFAVTVPPSQAIPPWYGSVRWTNTRASSQATGLGTEAAEKQPARRNGDLLQCGLKCAAGISNYGNWCCHWNTTSSHGLCKPHGAEELSTLLTSVSKSVSLTSTSSLPPPNHQTVGAHTWQCVMVCCRVIGESKNISKWAVVKILNTILKKWKNKQEMS